MMLLAIGRFPDRKSQPFRPTLVAPTADDGRRFSRIGTGEILYRDIRRNPERGTNSPSLPLLQDALVCA